MLLTVFLIDIYIFVFIVSKLYTILSWAVDVYLCVIFTKWISLTHLLLQKNKSIYEIYLVSRFYNNNNIPARPVLHHGVFKD